MGCDILAYVEVQDDNKKWHIAQTIFDFRNYGVFGFLANVRNYSAVPLLPGVHEGIPEDASEEYLDHCDDRHSYHWCMVDALTKFDYDGLVEDRCCMIGNDSGCTCEEGQGTIEKWSDFLGGTFLRDVYTLSTYDPDKTRVVYCFDS